MYRLYAPIYDRFMAPSFADGHSKMYKPLALKKGDYVLEVGIGTGISLKHYPDFVKVEAIDYSEPMLVKARKKVEKGEVKADVKIQQMDAHKLEFKDRQFDHSVVAHTLAVVADPDVVLLEMKRVTKPQGIIQWKLLKVLTQCIRSIDCHSSFFNIMNSHQIYLSSRTHNCSS